MKKIKQTIIIVLCLAGSWANAQQRKCGTMEHHQWMMENNPEYARSFPKTEKVIQQWIADHPNAASAKVNTAPDTIPVVVHVVYKTAAQNISDAQVMSQIDVLNEDFSRTNADSVNTPSAWQSIAGKMPYHFVLARQDPGGNPTTGIVRVQTTANSFSTNNAIKFNSQGGSDSWDVNTYLNIWVGNLGGGLLGYGEFPTGTPSNTYGFVCLYSAFGRVGTVSPPFDLGRTTTHEISHCFNLKHIWGDDGTACSGTDNVGDTPNQAGANFGCPSFPLTDACSASSPGVMFMNYLDYSDDVCMNMFTEGQATRMIAAVTNFYPTIVNSIGIQPVALQANDAGVSAIIDPAGVNCNTSITPVVTLRNFGTATLTAATINYRIDNNPIQTIAWTGTLASLSTVNVTLPLMTTTVGNHTFTSFTTQPNGLIDQNVTNDTSSVSFSVISSGQAVPYTQNFIAVTFPPTGWSINNADGSTTWDKATVSQGGGTGSLWMDNYNYQANGEIDEIVTQNFDLTTVSNPQMTFYLAYRLYTNPALSPNYSDTLEILISTDCGATYSSIYKKFGVPLTTTVTSWANNSFTPAAADWRQEVISLVPYASANSVIFKFKNVNDYENNLYVDNINISTITGINEVKSNFNLNAYPNPASDFITISLPENRNESITVTVQNKLGMSVYNESFKNKNGMLRINVSNFAEGVYSATIKGERINQSVKIVVKK